MITTLIRYDSPADLITLGFTAGLVLASALFLAGVIRWSRKEARLQTAAAVNDAIDAYKRARALHGDIPETRHIERLLGHPEATVADARLARRVAQNAAHPETTQRLAAVTR